MGNILHRAIDPKMIDFVINWCKGLNFHDDIIDAISIASNGQQLIVLVGETHGGIDKRQAEGLIAHIQELSDKLKNQHQMTSRVYTEAPRYESPSWYSSEKVNVCNDNRLTPSSAVCHDWKEVRRVDPRVFGLYDLPHVLLKEPTDTEEATPIAAKDAVRALRQEAAELRYVLINNVFWDMLTLYYEYVRSEVTCQLARLNRHDHWSLVSQQLSEFNDGIENIREKIRSIEDGQQLQMFLRNLHENLFSLSIGLDVLFLADVFTQDADVCVLFVGSAHVRRMHDVFAADPHWRVINRVENGEWRVESA